MSFTKEIAVFTREQVDSTMLEARRLEQLSKEGHQLTCNSLDGKQKSYIALESFVVIAREQLAGKGREDRSWLSTKDKGLYLTFVFYPKDKNFRIDGLTQVAALALIRGLNKLRVNANIKLPNDIVILNAGEKKSGEENEREKGFAKKISGILVDSKSQGSSIHAVYLGIGLNVKRQSFPKEILATTLEDVLGRELDLEEIFNLISLELFSHLDLFSQHGFEYFIRACKELIIDVEYS